MQLDVGRQVDALAVEGDGRLVALGRQPLGRAPPVAPTRSLYSASAEVSGSRITSPRPPSTITVVPGRMWWKQSWTPTT